MLDRADFYITSFMKISNFDENVLIKQVVLLHKLNHENYSYNIGHVHRTSVGQNTLKLLSWKRWRWWTHAKQIDTHVIDYPVSAIDR